MTQPLDIPTLSNLHTWLRPVEQAVAHIKPYEVRLMGLATPLGQHVPALPTVHDLLGKDGASYLLTFVWGMPTTHLAEANTHRMHSRGTASARAIPAATFAQNVRDFPVWPMRPGKNNPGMSSLTRMTPEEEAGLRETLEYFRTVALDVHAQLTARGAHKQIVNRVLDFFSYKPQVVTVSGGAPLANLLYTRMDAGADPAFRAQAVALWEALRHSYTTAGVLRYAEQPVYAPYVTETDAELAEAARAFLAATKEPSHLVPFWQRVATYYLPVAEYSDAQPLTPEVLSRLLVSTGRCGRVSTLTQEKATVIDDLRLGVQLVTGVDVRKAPLVARDPQGAPPQHPSPTEHQAFYYDVSDLTDEVESSELNVDEHCHGGWIRHGRQAQRFRGNFGPGWIQHRKLLVNEATSGAIMDADWLIKRLDAMAADWHADR